MKEIKLLLGLLFLATIYSCSTKTQQAGNKFDGMWRLDRFELFDSLANRWTDDTTRIGWSGYILYDGQGHMGVHITPKGYKDFDTSKNIDSLNQDELIAVAKFYKSNAVYFANYTLSENSVVHNRLSGTEPNNWGISLTRDFIFKQDTLILTPQEINAGQKQKLRLRWLKLD